MVGSNFVPLVVDFLGYYTVAVATIIQSKNVLAISCVVSIVYSVARGHGHAKTQRTAISGSL